LEAKVAKVKKQPLHVVNDYTSNQIVSLYKPGQTGHNACIVTTL